MKKKLLRLLVMAIAMVPAACGLFDDQSTPYGYVKSSFRLIDKYALHANADWIIERQSYLAEAKTIDSFEDAHKIVRDALAFAGSGQPRADPLGGCGRDVSVAEKPPADEIPLLFLR